MKDKRLKDQEWRRRVGFDNIDPKMPEPREINESEYMRNTVLLPMDPGAVNPILTRFGFFCCHVCDANRHAFLFDSEIRHYCDDCGVELVLMIQL